MADVSQSGDGGTVWQPQGLQVLRRCPVRSLHPHRAMKLSDLSIEQAAKNCQRFPAEPRTPAFAASYTTAPNNGPPAANRSIPLAIPTANSRCVNLSVKSSRSRSFVRNASSTSTAGQLVSSSTVHSSFVFTLRSSVRQFFTTSS